jgi:ergothioneine biosynthesis protein EgtB
MEDFLKKDKVHDLLLSIKLLRNQTNKLVEKLEIDDQVIQTANYVSPIKWHLGHTSWFFEKFVLSKYCKNYKLFSKDYDFIFNSYYETISHFNLREKRGNLSRPSLSEVNRYRLHVDKNLDLLFDIHDVDLENLLNIAFNHEQQHQELILMDIKHILFSNINKPMFIKKKDGIDCFLKKKKNEFILDSPVETKYGYDGSEFSFDNERPTSSMRLTPFILTDFVTNEDWIRFIEDRGYSRPELWLSDGWKFIKKNNINKPMYWIDNNLLFSLNGVEKINMNSPVSHISFYEAMAFARYKNSTLPSEFELEYVLKMSKKSGNFLENKVFKEHSYNSERFFGNFYGNLWVWSSSPYLPYNNYNSYKESLSEYNGKFMCNQFVLKGGSFATSINHIRATYRNFYYPHDRWQFAGLRLKKN